jgi:hypothetical protein
MVRRRSQTRGPRPLHESHANGETLAIRTSGLSPANHVLKAEASPALSKRLSLHWSSPGFAAVFCCRAHHRERYRDSCLSILCARCKPVARGIGDLRMRQSDLDVALRRDKGIGRLTRYDSYPPPGGRCPQGIPGKLGYRRCYLSTERAPSALEASLIASNRTECRHRKACCEREFSQGTRRTSDSLGTAGGWWWRDHILDELVFSSQRPRHEVCEDRAGGNGWRSTRVGIEGRAETSRAPHRKRRSTPPENTPGRAAVKRGPRKGATGKHAARRASGVKTSAARKAGPRKTPPRTTTRSADK